MTKTFFAIFGTSPVSDNNPVRLKTFRRFVFDEAVNKKYLLYAVALSVLQFIVFKICYPFADYITDSYTYIDAAASGAVVGYRPMGYSYLLLGLHLLTTSDTVLVLLQFLLIQAGALYLFFTIRYFFRLRKGIANTLFVITLANPVVLYLSNCVTSDAFYIGCSLFWFTGLLWIINRPHWRHMLEQALWLFILFKLRYTALYLPAISIITFLMSRQKWWFQLAGMALSVVPIFLEIKHIERLTEKELGTKVFSAFSGWSTANNALHIYPFTSIKDADFTSPQCVALNKIVKSYFDTIPAAQLPYPYVKVYYLWGNSTTPLKHYMDQVKDQRNVSYFVAWNAVAPTFTEYGNTLIKQHPLAYARYFMWPNAKVYLLPPVEALVNYNSNSDEVDKTAVEWFHYKSTHVRSVNKLAQRWLLYPVCYYFALLNIVFIALAVILLLRYKKIALPTPLLLSVLLAIACWGAYFLFSTFAAPIILRYQVFPLLQYTLMGGLMLECIVSYREKTG